MVDLPRNIVGFNAREGYVRNPATGKEVLANGRIGRSILAAHVAQLRASGAAVARGVIGRAPGVVAEAREVIVDWARMGPPVATGAFRAQNFVRRGQAAVPVATMARDIAATAAATPNFRQAVVSFEDPEGRIIRRTIHGRTAGDFLAAIDKLQTKGPLGGSDEIGVGYALNTSGFQVGSVTFPAGAAGKFTGVSKKAGRKHPHFRLIDFAGKANEGDCALAVLRAVAREYKLPVTAERNAKVRTRLGLPPGAIEATPNHIAALAKEFGLHIRVITGMAAPPDWERTFDDNRTRDEGRNRCVDPRAFPDIIADGGEPDAPPCDMYLAENHYEYIAGFFDVPLCPITGDVISNPDERKASEISRRVAAQGRNYFGVKRGEKREKLPRTERVIVFDYETACLNGSDVIEPYALGFIDIDPSTGEEDFSDAAGQVTQVIRRAGESRFAVTAPLLDLLAAAPPEVHYTLVSFNGARFDNFILAEAAQNRGVLSGIFATGAAGIRSLDIGRHTTLDLAKLCPAMSLAGACKGFATRPTKLEGFCHRVVQREANDGTLYDWLNTNRGELAEYLARDVLSTASLFAKISSTLLKLTGKPIYGKKAIGTIGGHAWAKMSDTCALPGRVSTQELDRTIRSAIVGGRVQCYREGTKHEFKEAHMLDFASLYPTVMAAVPKAASVFAPEERWGWYPSGAENSEPRRVDRWTLGEVGIYRATIHSQPEGLPNVLPRRGENPGEPLQWDYRGEFETWCTHVDLSLITRGGGRVTVHEGLVWPVTRPGLFEPFIRALAAGKDEQDAYEKAGDERFNPALRMMYKLLMNSASGKCCQNNYDDSVELATGSAAQIAAERKLDQSKPITWVPLGAETCLIIGKKPTEAVYRKTAKPSILAVLIYSNSRALVWRTLCQHGIIYGDTDSGLFEQSDFEAIRRAFPQMDPTGRRKELGDLEEELKPHARAVAFTLAPKDYAVFLYDENDEIDAKASKLRIKGVNMRTDRLITSPEALERLSKLSAVEYFDAYTTEQEEDSVPLANIKVAHQFYAERAAGAKVGVLASQMVRAYKDGERPFALEQRYMIKAL